MTVLLQLEVQCARVEDILD